MSEFKLYFTSVASCCVTVDADDLEEAVDLAYDELPSGVCASCAGYGGGPGIDVGDVWEFDEGGHEVDGRSVSGSGS